MFKNTLSLLAVAIPLLTMGAGCATQNTTNQTTPDYTTSSSTSNTTDSNGMSVTIEPGVVVAKVDVGASITTTASYMDALSMYEKNGMRFQFINCLGNPGSLTIKKGVKFMLDNRDNKSHQIGIDKKKYQLGAYDFAIISFQKTGRFNITCDNNSEASVNIEN